VEKRDGVLADIAASVKGSADNVAEKVQQLLEKNRALEKELERLKAKVAGAAGGELSTRAVEIDGVKVLAARLDDVDPKALRDMVDQLKNKLGSAAIVLATVKDDKVSLTAGVSKDQIARIKAGDLVNVVALKVGGKGGGRPDMAQAGGTNPAALDDALALVPEWVRAQLG
jgi:alanyl-tRNA synthetase